MRSSSRDSQLTSGLCQSVAATKSDFYPARLSFAKLEPRQLSVYSPARDSSPSRSFYKKSDSIYSICFIV